MTWTNSSNTRYRLYRDTDRGILAGVCAGIADYFGIQPIIVRAGFVLFSVFGFFPMTGLAYLVLALVLKPRPHDLFASPEEQAFWRGVAMAPDDTAQGLRRKFADLETRLRDMETQVTSSDFDLHRKFRNL